MLHEGKNLMLHEDITQRIISAATKVHTALGAGCLESISQLDAGYRIDFLVENCVIVELKAVEKLLPLHIAQMITYLKLSGRQVGLLINFNVPHLRQGIKRIVNSTPKNPVKRQDLTSASSASSVVDILKGNRDT